MRLETPWLLALLLLLLAPAWLAFRSRRRSLPTFLFPGVARLAAIRPGVRERLRHLPEVVLVAAIVLLIVAAARPRLLTGQVELEREGVDIVLVFDISTSMRAMDFAPDNRFNVARRVIKEFIAGRKNDRIGLVIFAGQAYTQVPPTLDYSILLNVLDRLETGQIEDGTAIGNALATAVNRLRDSQAKSKLVVLLTDGDNNAGNVAPREAASIAATFGVRVHTVLVGKGGAVDYPAGQDLFGRTVYRQVEIPINPKLLGEMSRATGGESFQAADAGSLAEIFRTIDRMEKSRLPDTAWLLYDEVYRWPALAAVLLLVFEALLRATVLRRYP